MCVCMRQPQIDLCVSATASDSVLNGSGSHMATCQQARGGNIILRRKGCCYQSAHVGLRERERERDNSARGKAGPRLACHISNSHSFCFPVSPFPLCLLSSCSLTRPGSLFTAQFRIALQCLRRLLCCKHTKV